MDELYEKKKQYDLSKLALFNKILNRIHVRIKTTSRQKIDEHFCWFIVPEIIIGVPKYDQGGCIAYLVDKLKDNGFHVRYVHPNALFISWHHFIPSYVRTELKNKTGIVIDEYGNKVEQEDELQQDSLTNTLTNMNTKNNAGLNAKSFSVHANQDNKNISLAKSVPPFKPPKKAQFIPLKDYTPIQSYKPSGNMVYNPSLLNTLQNKFN